MIDRALERALRTAASATVLLVASDYDGTLAPLVDDPADARPFEPAVTALRSLAALSGTRIALVSGRSICDLVALSGLADVAQLVGSHGAEFAEGEVEGLDATAADTLALLAGDLERVAAGVPGARVERKPASVAFHTREVTSEQARAAHADVLALALQWPGTHVKHGSDVVELAVVTADKGTAMRRLRSTSGADAVVFVGDDITDEDAFAVLGDGDVGVKVGPAPTVAQYRVADIAGVTDVLTSLMDLRRAAGRGRH